MCVCQGTHNGADAVKSTEIGHNEMEQSLPWIAVNMPLPSDISTDYLVGHTATTTIAISSNTITTIIPERNQNKI